MRLAISLVTLGLAVIASSLASCQDKLRIIDRPTITVAPLCNLEGAGNGSFTLRNETNATVPIHFSAGDFSSKAPIKHLSIQPTLNPKDASLEPKQACGSAIRKIGWAPHTLRR
jgi:hypothetical protein